MDIVNNYLNGATPTPDNRSLCKSWAKIITDTTIAAGYNVASVTKQSNGRYTITFITPMASNLYCVTLGQERGNGSASYGYMGTHSHTVNGFQVAFADTNANPADPYSYSFAVFGD